MAGGCRFGLGKNEKLPDSTCFNQKKLHTWCVLHTCVCVFFILSFLGGGGGVKIKKLDELGKQVAVNFHQLYP